MTEEEIKQNFRELNVSLDYLCLQTEKDAGNAWIAFTDKFNTFQKKVLTLATPEPVSVKTVEDERYFNHFAKVISDRINHFSNIHHSFEAQKLHDALNVIISHVPPSCFDTVKGLSYNMDYLRRAIGAGLSIGYDPAFDIDKRSEMIDKIILSLPPAPVKSVGDVMRWVKASECPIESGEYFIKFTTGQYRGQKSTAYYSRKGNIWMWSIQGGFVEDSHLLEWLEENVKPVEGETITLKRIAKERADHYGEIGKMGKEAFEKVTLGTDNNPKSMFILGFIAGYLKKEKGETITGVEEAAKEYSNQFSVKDMPVTSEIKRGDAKRHFEAGAEWQAQQAKQPNH